MKRTHLWLIETRRECDELRDLPDGSWGTFRVPPPGEGWRIILDRERCTIFERRTPVRRPERRRRT